METREMFTITNTTQTPLPGVSFLSIKNKILGKTYTLSLVFIGETKSRELNRTYRNKDKSTNVLSFNLGKKEGEIFITPAVAKREHKKFEKNLHQFITYLFIHGCLHLKGMEHGSRMEEAEEKLQKQFSA